jgi:hypothetical protein
LIDKMVIYPHLHVMDAADNRHYTTRAIPYQDPEMEAEWLKAVHEARVKIVPGFDGVANYARPGCKTRRLLLRSVVVVRAVQAM